MAGLSDVIKNVYKDVSEEYIKQSFDIPGTSYLYPTLFHNLFHTPLVYVQIKIG